VKKIHTYYKWELVILLWLAFFFNQADRQIFNIVLPSLRDDLGFSDADMGLIASVFTLFYGLMVPVGGVLGDRANKKYILIVSLLIWSTATLLTGSSYTLFQLIALRSIALGGGEAFYAPSANSLICEYHKNTRATAISIHQTALYVGIIGSGYLTGFIADSFGWRMAFYLFGGFGILLATVIYFRVLDSKVMLNDVVQTDEKKTVKEVIKVFFNKPTAIFLALAFASFQFAGVGFLTWMPTFLHEKFNLSLTRAGFDSTFYHFVAAFFGVLVGARITDKLAPKYYRIRGFTQMVGLVIGAPFLFILGKSDSLLIIYLASALLGFCRGVYDSNIFAALYDVIEIPYRSTATGLMLMFAFVIGSAAPYLLGILKPIFGLSNGLAFLSISFLFAAICVSIALIFFYKKDKI
jgi:sugar phosphate permease